jgi:hypothetical protein
MDILVALKQEEAKFEEAGKCGAATVGQRASCNEALRWYEWQWQSYWQQQW